LYIALDCIIFGTGVELALHANQGRISRMAGNLLIPECPDYRTLRLATPRHKRKDPIKVPEK
jgi:hypothetical protein